MAAKKYKFLTVREATILAIIQKGSYAPLIVCVIYNQRTKLKAQDEILLRTIRQMIARGLIKRSFGGGTVKLITITTKGERKLNSFKQKHKGF